MQVEKHPETSSEVVYQGLMSWNGVLEYAFYYIEITRTQQLYRRIDGMVGKR